MVGKLAKVFLETFERLRALRGHPRREHRGEDLERIAKLLPLDPKGVNLGIRVETAVDAVEEAAHQPAETPPGVDLEDFVRVIAVRDGIDESLDTALPVGRDQAFHGRVDRLPGTHPLPRQHRDEAAPTRGARLSHRLITRVSRQAFGQHVEIPGVSGSPPNSSQPLLEPCAAFGRQQPSKGGEGGDRPAGGDAEPMHAVGIVSGPARTLQRRPDRLESPPQRARGHVADRSPRAIDDDLRDAACCARPCPGCHRAYRGGWPLGGTSRAREAFKPSI